MGSIQTISGKLSPTVTVKDYYKDKSVDSVARDSTAISAREKPVNKKKDVKAFPQRKRGRPKKGQEREKKSLTVLEEQGILPLHEAIGGLPSSCAWGLQEELPRKL